MGLGRSLGEPLRGEVCIGSWWKEPRFAARKLTPSGEERGSSPVRSARERGLALDAREQRPEAGREGWPEAGREW